MKGWYTPLNRVLQTECILPQSHQLTYSLMKTSPGPVITSILSSKADLFLSLSSCYCLFPFWSWWTQILICASLLHWSGHTAMFLFICLFVVFLFICFHCELNQTFWKKENNSQPNDHSFLFVSLQVHLWSQLMYRLGSCRDSIDMYTRLLLA